MTAADPDDRAALPDRPARPAPLQRPWLALCAIDTPPLQADMKETPETTPEVFA
jgi:hypothetical protein